MHEMGYGGYGTPEKPIYATASLRRREMTTRRPNSQKSFLPVAELYC